MQAAALGKIIKELEEFKKVEGIERGGMIGRRYLSMITGKCGLREKVEALIFGKAETEN
jgi:hypothetical protein